MAEPTKPRRRHVVARRPTAARIDFGQRVVELQRRFQTTSSHQSQDWIQFKQQRNEHFQSALQIPCVSSTQAGTRRPCIPGLDKAGLLMSNVCALGIRKTRESGVVGAPDFSTGTSTSSPPRQIGKIPARTSPVARKNCKGYRLPWAWDNLPPATSHRQRWPTNAAVRWSRTHPHPAHRARAPLPTALNKHVKGKEERTRP